MPLVKVLRDGNATIYVEVNAEVLFMPTGPVGKWSTLFVERLERNTKSFAPRNKRPHWSHYGPVSLKNSISSGIDYDPMTLQVHGAVGSSVNYATYVDQGTGVFAGGAPYKAKILPPYTRGGASLYEHTWVPSHGEEGANGGMANRVRAVWIKGQKPQHFFEKGLARTFTQMRNRAFQVPGDPRISSALASVPASVMGSVLKGTNNGANPAFVADLKMWRAWRDEAWGSSKMLGRNPEGRSSAKNYRRKYDPARTADARSRQDALHKLATGRKRRYRRHNESAPKDPNENTTNNNSKLAAAKAKEARERRAADAAAARQRKRQEELAAAKWYLSNSDIAKITPGNRDGKAGYMIYWKTKDGKAPTPMFVSLETAAKRGSIRNLNRRKIQRPNR